MITATKIIIGFSESPYITEGQTFEGGNLWEESSHYLNKFPGPDLGYYKTDFTVTFEDGEEYEGRYDIGADRPTLDDHVRCFLAGYAPKDPELARFQDSHKIGD